MYVSTDTYRMNELIGTEERGYWERRGDGRTEQRKRRRGILGRE